MTDNQFFGDLGSYAYSDLLKEREVILERIKGDGPIAQRARVLVDALPEAVRRYYVHKDSNTFIKVIVLVWTGLVLLAKMVIPSIASVNNTGKNETTPPENQSIEKTDDQSPSHDEVPQTTDLAEDFFIKPEKADSVPEIIIKNEN